MSRLASAARFGHATTPGSWYDPPFPTTLAEVAARWPMFRQRASWIAQRYPTVTRIGIAGAGFGWTGYWLTVDHAKEVYMCDIAWATDVGIGVLPAVVRTRLAAHDLTTSTGATGFRRMGMSGQTRYPLVFSEDILPCAESEAEVQTLLTNLRATGTTVVHLVTPQTGNETTPDMLWRTPAQWRGMIGPDETILLPWMEEVP